MRLIQFVMLDFWFRHQSPNAFSCTQDDDPCGDFQPFYERAHAYRPLRAFLFSSPHPPLDARRLLQMKERQ